MLELVDHLVCLLVERSIQIDIDENYGEFHQEEWTDLCF